MVAIVYRTCDQGEGWAATGNLKLLLPCASAVCVCVCVLDKVIAPQKGTLEESQFGGNELAIRRLQKKHNRYFHFCLKRELFATLPCLRKTMQKRDSQLTNISVGLNSSTNHQEKICTDCLKAQIQNSFIGS